MLISNSSSKMKARKSFFLLFLQNSQVSSKPSQALFFSFHNFPFKLASKSSLVAASKFLACKTLVERVHDAFSTMIYSSPFSSLLHQIHKAMIYCGCRFDVCCCCERLFFPFQLILICFFFSFKILIL